MYVIADYLSFKSGERQFYCLELFSISNMYSDFRTSGNNLPSRGIVISNISKHFVKWKQEHCFSLPQAIEKSKIPTGMCVRRFGDHSEYGKLCFGATAGKKPK